MENLPPSIELTTTTSHEQLFPTFYRRTPAIIPKPAAETNRVIYAPMPEQQKLGYFSTAALIVSKVIGSGIFAKPSAVLAGCGGKGQALGLWAGGGLVSLAGILVYVELGIALPFSGGEIVYVDEAFPRPKYLLVILVSFLFVFFTHWAGNCLTFSKLVLQAFNPSQPTPNEHLEKFIALVMLTAVCALHVFSRKMGIAVNNLLAIYKVALVGFIIVTGIAASSTGPGDGEGGASGWETVNLDPGVGDYASAVLGVLWAYTGWENANYVLSEVRRPLGNEGRVFKVAAFSSVGLLTTLYMLCNMAYFRVLTWEELVYADEELVASMFFIKVFGRTWFSERALKILVALSVLGNYVSSTYSVARVKQEIGKLRILPYSRFWARQSSYDTPVGGLVLHWIVAAGFIVFTPQGARRGDIYDLVTDLFVYGQTWMVLAVTVGLLVLRRRGWVPAVGEWKWVCPVVVGYLLVNVGVLVLGWWPGQKGFIAPMLVVGVILLALMYWGVFAGVLPAMGFVVDAQPDELVDGSRVVSYKRYRTGWAKRMEERWRGWRGKGEVVQ